MRIRSTAKPKSNRPSAMVCQRLSICQDCAAPLEIVASTWSVSSPARCAKLTPSASACSSPRDADLVDHLGELAGAGRAQQRDRAAVGVQHRLGARERARLAAAHDRERPVLRTRLPAGHRRVDEVRPCSLPACASSRATRPRPWCGRRGSPAGSSPARMPSAPWTTERRSSSLPTQVNTISACAAASRGVAARRPGKRAHQSSARAGVRLKTVTSWPLLARWPAMGKPITPSPMNAALAMRSLLLRAPRTLVARVSRQQGETGWRCHPRPRRRYSPLTSRVRPSHEPGPDPRAVPAAGLPAAGVPHAQRSSSTSCSSPEATLVTARQRFVRNPRRRAGELVLLGEDQELLALARRRAAGGRALPGRGRPADRRRTCPTASRSRSPAGSAPRPTPA